MRFSLSTFNLHLFTQCTAIEDLFLRKTFWYYIITWAAVTNTVLWLSLTNSDQSRPTFCLECRHFSFLIGSSDMGHVICVQTWLIFALSKIVTLYMPDAQLLITCPTMKPGVLHSVMLWQVCLRWFSIVPLTTSLLHNVHSKNKWCKGAVIIYGSGGRCKSENRVHSVFCVFCVLSFITVLFQNGAQKTLF